MKVTSEFASRSVGRSVSYCAAVHLVKYFVLKWIFIQGSLGSARRENCVIVLCNSIVKITDLTTFASVRYVSKLLFSDLVDVLV